MQIHFIFRHKNPVTGKYEEKHAKAVDTNMGFFDDKKTHIFRLGWFIVTELQEFQPCIILLKHAVLHSYKI